MQARPRPDTPGQQRPAHQRPPGQDSRQTIQEIDNVLKTATLGELGLRSSEDKLGALYRKAGVIGDTCARQGIGKTQMMNLMGRLRGMDSAPTIADMRLLRAHLAYQVAKDQKLGILKSALDPWFDRIDSEWETTKGKNEDEREEWSRRVFDSFIGFVESIVAFHRLNVRDQGGTQ